MSLKSWTVFCIKTVYIKTKEIEIRIQIRKVYFRIVYETKKTFEIYEISSILNVVNTLLAAVIGVGVEGCTVVPPPPPISVLKFLCCV